MQTFPRTLDPMLHRTQGTCPTRPLRALEPADHGEARTDAGAALAGRREARSSSATELPAAPTALHAARAVSGSTVRTSGSLSSVSAR